MIESISEWIEELYRLVPERARHLAIIGGGALRSFFDHTFIKDIDLFFRSTSDLQDAIVAFKQAGAIERDAPLGTYLYYYNGVALNLVGFHFVSDIEDAAEKFDFRCVCMAASYSAAGEVAFHAIPGAIDDAVDKVLNFQTMQRTNRVAKRLRRYVDGLGYVPSEEFILALPRCAVIPAGTGVAY